ncbi:hypothetical protein [Streptomyces sp. LN699]|uniref:hypothetical protein n=1 Tax=Streptomyces sp. LN699 TaxID=3112981 RepID=UPI003723484D
MQIYAGVRLLLPESGLYWEDLAWLSFALSLRSEELSARFPGGVCIEITAVDFPLSDYRPEVAALAMDGWLREEFHLPDAGIACTYSGEPDPYTFTWGDAQPHSIAPPRERTP